MIHSTWIYEQGVVETEAAPEFDAGYDMIVAGLGSAGSLALITAARRGLRVLGLDKLSLMGGSGTAGGISSYYRGIPGGRFEEIDRRVGPIAQASFVPSDRVHPEARALALEEAALEAGAETAFGARIIGVYREGRRVRGIEWLSREGGRRHTACDLLIDATGDGEVCALAGCAFTHGRDFDGIPQPYSHVPCLMVDGKLTTRNFDVAATAPADDGETLSRAAMHGAVLHLRDAYREEEKLLFSGRLLGLREGRLITGETVLTLRDTLDGRLSPRPVFYEFSNLDTHTQDWAFESDTMQEFLTVSSLWDLEFTVPVPLEAMIPKGFEGIMTAGRCLSVDHDLSQAVRMQRAMQQCGEAVATAAALARERGIPVREVPYEVLAAELRKTGCLPETTPPPYVERLSDDPEVIRKGLASEHPGLAIGSARKRGDAIKPALREWMTEAHRERARNAALALGLLGDAEARPMLRRIIRERDPAVPKSSRKQNAKRLCAALYLAGRLHDGDIIDDCAALLEDPGREFDVFSYAYATLVRIAGACPETRPRAAEILRRVLEDPHFAMTLPRHRGLEEEPSTAYFRIAAARELDRWRLPHALWPSIDPAALTLRERALYRRGPVG